MNKVITEITNLGEKDCFYLVERYKEEFSYPLHKHEELELNFVAHCRGARRIVGDSMEVLGEYDLCLVGGGLEHVWEQHECRSSKIHEITIQFSRNLLSEQFLAKNPMRPINKLMENAKLGIAYGTDAIMPVYAKLVSLTEAQPGFGSVLAFLDLLHELSMQEDYHLLASKSFSSVSNTHDSRRVRRVQEYIDQNFQKEIRLNDLASLAGMTPTAFSRFFHLHTHKTVSDYTIDIRLGHATRMLVDSSHSVAEICYACGFNNISNFNRIFKKKKGCSPTIFRENYHKSKIII
ncbi:MAG: AraC family transcriptional regulator [Bacteroidaceae bacterium]|nr:AraC family transcriptional regulator [Bacteroidaceae bacterium]